MLSGYIPILVLSALAILTPLGIVILSSHLGHRSPNPAKLAPYECGVTDLDSARKPTSVRFYLIAMMFIVFDVEAAFLYPWVTVMAELKPAAVAFGEVVAFLGVLFLGYLYIWKKGALDWE